MIITIMAVAVMVISCQKSEVSTNNIEPLYAKIENVASTRTVMDADNNILWSEGDRIVAFMKTSLGLTYEVSSSSVGKSSAKFEEVSEEDGGLNAGTELDHNVAFYPYSETIECLLSRDNYVLNVLLPSEQIYAEGSFGNGSMPMVAVSENNNITFRNVCGGIKLLLKGTQKVASIRIEGNDDEKLSGIATVTAYADETKPEISMSSEALTYAVLNCGTGIQLNETIATEFIVALPPVVFSKGFSITVIDTNGNIQIKETDKCNQVLRSSLLVMPEVFLEDEEPVEVEERWVDLGLSVKWAKCNLGADSPEEYGYAYSWGELEEKYIYDYGTHKYFISIPIGDGTYTTEGAIYIGDEISGTQYDAAFVNGKDGERMPTEAEALELMDKCWWGGGEVNGVSGYYAHGPNGNSIFFPLNGYMYDRSKPCWNEGACFYSWTGTYFVSDEWNKYGLCAKAFIINMYDDIRTGNFDRKYGLPIRPVKP